MIGGVLKIFICFTANIPFCLHPCNSRVYSQARILSISVVDNNLQIESVLDKSRVAAGKGLTSWLSFVVSSVSLSLSHWYPGSGVVLGCIDSWSLQPYLLCIAGHVMVLYSHDWTNMGFYYILLTVNLYRHSTLIEHGLHRQLFYTEEVSCHT